MTRQDYYIAVGKALDLYFLPTKKDAILEALLQIMRTDMIEHYKNNRAPEMAAELIAFKLGLARQDKAN